MKTLTFLIVFFISLNLIAQVFTPDDAVWYYGNKDILVPAKINQGAIKEALIKSGNMDFTIIEIEGLNHGFQMCKTCSVTEGKDLEQTFSTDAQKKIKDWISLKNEKPKYAR